MALAILPLLCVRSVENQQMNRLRPDAETLERWRPDVSHPVQISGGLGIWIPRDVRIPRSRDSHTRQVLAYPSLVLATPRLCALAQGAIKRAYEVTVSVRRENRRDPSTERHRVSRRV